VSFPAATRSPFFDRLWISSDRKLVLPLCMDVPDTMTTGGNEERSRVDRSGIA
jgi:hypothetical protein